MVQPRLSSGEQLASDFQSQLANERRQAANAAKAFVQACTNGDAEAMQSCAQWLADTIGGWPIALRLVGKLGDIPPESKHAFETIWVESKGFSKKVTDRRVISRALEKLLPGGSVPDGSTIYRGARASERRGPRYGYSWTTELEIARSFAEGYRQPYGSVILATIVPPKGIFLVRRRGDWWDEGEVVVDPFALTSVSVVERLPWSS
jgi:hypothetical protein